MENQVSSIREWGLNMNNFRNYWTVWLEYGNTHRTGVKEIGFGPIWRCYLFIYLILLNVFGVLRVCVRMCTCMYVCMCVRRGMCVCKPAMWTHTTEGRGWRWTSSPVTDLPYFLRPGSHWAWSSVFQLGWLPSKPQDLLVFASSQNAGVTVRLPSLVLSWVLGI